MATQPLVRAPEFDLPDLNDDRVTLTKLTQEGPVLVAFFKISCPTCQYTFPYLQRLANSNLLRVIGISQDDLAATRRFSETYSLTFPILLDAASAKYLVSNAYRITTVPSLFLIEPDHSISKLSNGFTRRDLEEIGGRFGFVPFRADEQIPEFRPG
jgi:peroxiredoxin